MGNNGVKEGVAKVAGHEFTIVKKGLDKVQVAAFINKLVRQRDELTQERDILVQRGEHLLSLTRLAERTVIEADKLTEEIRREAIERAKAEAKVEADKLTEEIKRQAMEEVKAEADVIITRAEEQSQEQTRRLYGQFLSQLEDFKQQVAGLHEETEHKLSQSTGEVNAETAEKKSPSARVPATMQPVSDVSPGANPEASPEGADDKNAEPQGPVPIIDLTDKKTSPEKAPALAENQDLATYEKEVELDILPPVNVIKIMEIMKYLDNLPEVEDTELIPRPDKPSIMVSQCGPIHLVDILKKLPQVDSVKGATGADAENGKRKNIEITLSGVNVAS